jgi:hypothetical protein
MNKIHLRILALIIVISIGLGSRLLEIEASWIRNYLGYILYATMIFFLMRITLSQTTSDLKVRVYAVAFCFAIEFLQLVQIPFLVYLRTETPLKYILGQGFLYSDLFCYAVGSALGFYINKVIETFSIEEKI